MNKDGRLHVRTTQETSRLVVVGSMLEGESVAVVMDSLGLCLTTCYQWLIRMQGRGRGERVPNAGKCTGRPGKLDDAQKRQVLCWINGKNTQRR
jgi:transposase